MKDRGCCKQDPLNTYFSSCAKLDSYDWLQELSGTEMPEVVEVRFKNTRKGVYLNVNELRLKRGDIVAVEASPGHDIGVVNLVGVLADKQLGKSRHRGGRDELRKVYRIAKEGDLDKWNEAIEKEHDTMIRSRKLAADLGLNMKIGDVEYQGDKTKAIFYYIADERVDFRELIKVLAENFRIRIEMKQIGARQEAGRIGGIGTCGRELCCSTFVSSFVSVSTQAARVQEVALNPQKLAGQCGKLKCCLNFELSSYEDARKKFPKAGLVLRTAQGDATHLKTDVYRGIMWYVYNGGSQNLLPIPVERVAEIEAMNRKGELPDELLDAPAVRKEKSLEYTSAAGQGSLTRFEKPGGKNKRRKKRPPRNDQRTK